MKLKLLALVVLLAVGADAVILAMGGIAAASDQPRYLTSTVTRGTISQDVTSTGTVAASRPSTAARAGCSRRIARRARSS